MLPSYTSHTQAICHCCKEEAGCDTRHTKASGCTCAQLVVEAHHQRWETWRLCQIVGQRHAKRSGRWLSAVDQVISQLVTQDSNTMRNVIVLAGCGVFACTHIGSPQLVSLQVKTMFASIFCMYLEVQHAALLHQPYIIKALLMIITRCCAVQAQQSDSQPDSVHNTVHQYHAVSACG